MTDTAGTAIHSSRASLMTSKWTYIATQAAGGMDIDTFSTVDTDPFPPEVKPVWPAPWGKTSTEAFGPQPLERSGVRTQCDLDPFFIFKIVEQWWFFKVGSWLVWLVVQTWLGDEYEWGMKGSVVGARLEASWTTSEQSCDCLLWRRPCFVAGLQWTTCCGHCSSSLVQIL